MARPENTLLKELTLKIFSDSSPLMLSDSLLHILQQPNKQSADTDYPFRQISLSYGYLSGQNTVLLIISAPLSNFPLRKIQWYNITYHIPCQEFFAENVAVKFL